MAKYHPKRQPIHHPPPPSQLDWQTLLIESKETKLHRDSWKEKQLSQVSLVSAVSSDNSHGSLVYQDVKQLFRDLLPEEGDDERFAESIDHLGDNVIDARVRDKTPHQIQNIDIRNRIQMRYERNYGSNRTSWYGEYIPDDTFGLDPNIPIAQMRNILKAQEKAMLVHSLRQVWEEERGPTSNWWELKDGRFALENEKCRRMLSPRNQIRQFSVRERLFDLRRQLQMEIEMQKLEY